MSVGIIGGADGPTAVYIASSTVNWVVITGAAVAATAAVITVIILVRKKGLSAKGRRIRVEQFEK